MQAIPFDPLDYPHPSRRTVVYARNGMTCAGNPTAASVGLQVLLKGGNAVDAAVAMAAVMPLAEPTGNGLGSDAFVMVWKDGKLYGLNGSGPSPKQLRSRLSEPKDAKRFRHTAFSLQMSREPLVLGLLCMNVSVSCSLRMCSLLPLNMQKTGSLFRRR